MKVGQATRRALAHSRGVSLPFSRRFTCLEQLGSSPKLHAPSPVQTALTVYGPKLIRPFLSALAQNRIPSCPLCSTPISIPTSTDPNLIMDQHLSTTCPTLHPHLKPPKPANVCAEKKCKTKMIVPITCDACRQNFCAKHRFGGDHGCPGKPALVGGGKGGLPGGKVKLGLSGLAALRRAQEAIKPSTNLSNARSPIPLGRKGNPIVISDSEPSSGSDSDLEIIEPKGASKGASTAKGVKAMASVGVGRKVDKRAMAEQESQRRGLEARAKKGWVLTFDFFSFLSYFS